jgi:membrane protein implicated in regulation of membrane protease activity
MLMPDPVQFWHWWALGGVLSIVEVFAPGFMFLWIGIAAGLVGCLLLVWPGLEVPGQIFAFAILSVASLIVWSRFQKVRPAKSDEPTLNRRGAQYVGQRGALLVPIVNGRGRIRLGDSSWSVTGPDLPAGVPVEVTGIEGTVLRVRPVVEARPDPKSPPLPDATRPEGSAA